MLTLSKIGEHRGAPEDLNTGDLVSTAARRWSAEAGAASIRLTRSLSNPGVVSCAGADAERALDALIENAIRYSPEGTTIELRALPHAIEVVDQGPGIPEEEREAVFERFRRGTTGRAGPRGTGLGLAIARALLRAWGGDVTLGDAAGGGTRATLLFPDPRNPAPAAALIGAGAGRRQPRRRSGRLMSGRALKIGLLAVAGLLVAAALGVAASRITSEQVGLYGQPPSVGRDLASGPVHVPGGGGAAPPGQARQRGRQGAARGRERDDAATPRRPRSSSHRRRRPTTIRRAEPPEVESEEDDSDDD